MIKLTLILDPDESEQLIGLVAKAYGRRELGIDEMRIERDAPKALAPVKQSTIAKLVAARELPKPKRKGRIHAPRPGTGAFIGLEIVASGVPNPNTALKAAYAKVGLSQDGAGATLSKLATRGYLRNVGPGEWKLTAKGEAVMKEREHEKVEHNDSAND
ncbi:MAG TPA: hypothetical protein VHT52_10475 [Stellaceae bacterium]|jgi:hypothetical protein|nr:hypothetical protein [Stellaceae bacterium]